ncbi:MAG: hypothetical protein MSD82_02130 [Prevotella sp.]|nr:hypothetical protein [Prevotella sp.]
MKHYIKPQIKVKEVGSSALMLEASNTLGSSQLSKENTFEEEIQDPDPELETYSVWEN